MTDSLDDPRILVTGSGGQLGSQLCLRLGSRAVGVDLPEFDLTSPQQVRAAIDRHRPDIIINTAGYTNVEQAEVDPDRCRAVNVDGVGHLAEVCSPRGIQLVQISTDYVFDGCAHSSYVETDTPNPLNIYGATKLAAEQLVAELPRHLIVRTAALFGPPGPTSGGNFVDTILSRAERGWPLQVVNDQRTSPTYTPHLAVAIEALLKSNAVGLFHVTGLFGTTWAGFASRALEIAGYRLDIESIPSRKFRCRARRPFNCVLCLDKYHTTPSLPPMPDWKTGLREYLQATRNSP